MATPTHGRTAGQCPPGPGTGAIHCDWTTGSTQTSHRRNLDAPVCADECNAIKCESKKKVCQIPLLPRSFANLTDLCGLWSVLVPAGLRRPARHQVTAG